MKKSPQNLYEFEREVEGIFDEAYFAFSERYKKDPSAAETYLRYLKDVLFIDTDEHLALFKTYKRPFMEREIHSVETTQDSPPVPRSLKRI